MGRRRRRRRRKGNERRMGTGGRSGGEVGREGAGTRREGSGGGGTVHVGIVQQRQGDVGERALLLTAARGGRDLSAGGRARGNTTSTRHRDSPPRAPRRLGRRRALPQSRALVGVAGARSRPRPAARARNSVSRFLSSSPRRLALDPLPRTTGSVPAAQVALAGVELARHRFEGRQVLYLGRLRLDAAWRSVFSTLLEPRGPQVPSEELASSR